MATRDRNISWDQLGLTVQRERLDTGLLLAIGEAASKLSGDYDLEHLAVLFALPGQGRVTPRERMREVLQVYRFWEGDVLHGAVEFGAPWSALLEVAQQEDADRDAILESVDRYVQDHHAWPTVNFMRRITGRAPTRRLPGEQEGQGSLM